MLADKDRIFTNIYGRFDRSLAGAMKRGCWDGTKGIERPKTVDDLKLISGVGPKTERILHDLGIFTFAQVAGWNAEQREWVDGYLAFSGRIEREDWMKQARALAKGGVAEYVRVFGKKPV